MRCADVNERYSPFSVHEKILLWDKEKAKYCYLALLLLFHFSAIIFHVDSCESYATLDTPRGEKSGLFSFFSISCVDMDEMKRGSYLREYKALLYLN